MYIDRRNENRCNRFVENMVIQVKNEKKLSGMLEDLNRTCEKFGMIDCKEHGNRKKW